MGADGAAMKNLFFLSINGLTIYFIITSSYVMLLLLWCYSYTVILYIRELLTVVAAMYGKRHFGTTNTCVDHIIYYYIGGAGFVQRAPPIYLYTILYYVLYGVL
jgi:hypothetical protein